MNTKNFTSIDEIELKETGFLHLTHPVSGEELYLDDERKEAIGINLYGTDSSVYKDEFAKQTNKRVMSNRKRKKSDYDYRESTSDARKLAAKCTHSFVNLFKIDSSEYKLSEAESLYESKPWIFDQVQEYMLERSNFLD